MEQDSIMTIDAYFNKHSFKPGETAKLAFSSDETSIDIELIRQGREDRTVWSASGMEAVKREIPADVVENGCAWPATVEIDIPPEWTSGFYLARLYPHGRRDVEPGLAFFVLRPSKRKASILIGLTTSTWEAYNDFGGANTYSSGSASYEAGAAIVSRQRPMARGMLWKSDDFVRLANTDTDGEDLPFLAWAIENGFSNWTGGAGWWNWEYPFVRWAEEEGIELDYACSDDLDADPSVLDGYTLFLSVGHDEYWSWNMRDHVEAFIAGGGNVMFLTGNTSFWQVRWNDARDQMTTYKSAFRDDPVFGTDNQSRTTGLWSNVVTGRPENTMTGLSFCRGGYARMVGCSPKGPGGYMVYRPDHWVFEGTGLRFGDLVGAKHAMIGYETDGCDFQMVNGLPVPTGEDGTPETFEILGLAPAALMNKDTALEGFYPEGTLSDVEVVADQAGGGITEKSLAKYAQGHAIMGVYERGGTVFNSGCTDWTCALSAGDPAVVQITRNLFARLAK